MRGLHVFHIFAFLWIFFGTSESTERYFWHLTDMHFDPTYKTIQESCNEAVANPGRYGDYECDSPYELVVSSVHAMKQLGGRDPQFILYTGDNPHHPKNRTYSNISSTEYVKFMLGNMTALFKEEFPSAKFVMTIGNHDYYPKDQLPGATNPLYEDLAEMWKPHFNYSTEAVNTFKQGAYYTMMIDDEMGIRVVVINTNLYLAKNDVTVGDPDPAGQYAWLQTVLQTARTNREKIFMIGHVPIGVMPAEPFSVWLREADNLRLNTIISDNSDVILTYYGCHEHLDTFRLVYKDGHPAVPLFVTPSVTPWRARLGNGILGTPHNPGIRKYTYDGPSGQLLDIEQYYLDLPKAKKDNDDIWRRLYSFRAIYNIENVTASELHGLVKRFKQYGNTEFHSYYDMNSVGVKGMDVPPCSCECKFMHICSMEHIVYSEFTECHNSVTCRAAALSSTLSAILGIFYMLTIQFLV